MKEQLRQHQKSKKHQANSSLKRPLVQSPLEFKDPKAKRQCTREEEVGQELCDALLAASLELLVEAHEKISQIPRKIGKVVQNKLDSVLGKNPGAQVLREISATPNQW